MKDAKVIAKTGCDIVYVPRFEKLLTRTPKMRRKIFTVAEEKGRGMNSLAGVYAAKEAVIKALELQLTDLKRIEIKKDRRGRPYVEIKELRERRVDISISHDGDYAMATAVFVVSGR